MHNSTVDFSPLLMYSKYSWRHLESLVDIFRNSCFGCMASLWFLLNTIHALGEFSSHSRKWGGTVPSFQI